MATIRKRSWTTGAGAAKVAWQVDYTDQGGKRRARQFKSRKAADAFMVGARYEVRQGTHTAASASLTVAQAVEQWLERSDSRCDAQTVRSYRAVARHHLAPLGHTRLAALTRPAVEAYVDDLQAGRLPDKRKRSPIMARAALQALKAVLADAMRRGQVAQNVARDVRVDRTRGEAKPKKEIGVNVPGKPEIRAMLEAVAPRWRPLLVTAIFTGCRASELRALRWRDVDLVARLIKVRQRADRWGGLGDPKSAAGSREIPMAPMLLNTLREWKLACPPSPGDLVFPGAGRAAGVLNHATLTRSVFGKTQIAAKIVDAAGKPKYSAHDFRHFFASWLIDQGFGPKRIMAILGHASIDVTFDVYGHLFELNESDHDRLAAGELALVTG